VTALESRLEKADEKLQDFMRRWKEHYKLTDSEAASLLAKSIVLVNNMEFKTEIKEEVREEKNVIGENVALTKVPELVAKFPWIMMIYYYGRLVYVNEEIKHHIDKRAIVDVGVEADKFGIK
jgi:hypothetical protein